MAEVTLRKSEFDVCWACLPLMKLDKDGRLAGMALCPDGYRSATKDQPQIVKEKLR